MHPLHRFIRPLRALFNKSKLEQDMAEEMRFHLEQRTAGNLADGMGPDEAPYAARRQFGNVASIQEQAREGRGWRWLERLAQDLRLGGRSLAQSPGFTGIAIVTLGLGIGANTSMFSLLNGIMLKPLPFAHLAQLERIYRATAQNQAGNISPADFLDLQRARDGYGDVAAYTPASVSLAEPGHPAEMAYAARATANFFPLLGVQPQLGRAFRPAEDTPGRDRVVVLSQRTWQNRFGGSPAVIGRTVRIDGEPHEIIGVLPASFNDWRYLGAVDFFRPLPFAAEFAADRKQTELRVLGRRDPARTPGEAASFIAGLGARLARDHPAANAETTWRSVDLQSVAGGPAGNLIPPLLIGLSAFVLLIACSNLANLLLARTMARSREFAVRAALGASRVQLLRPLIAEALLLAFAGGGVAIVVAAWFRDWAAARSTGDNGEQVVFTVDWSVMTWAFGASLVTAVVFGLAPALFALRLNLNETLKSGGRGTTGGRGHQRFRQFLIIGQFALAMILLAGAGLFILGLNDLSDRRAGWTSAQVVTGTIALPAGTYGDDAKITAFHQLMLERLAARPGVAAVSLSAFTPAFIWPDIRKFVIDGQDRPPSGREPAAVVNRVSPGYLETFHTRLLSGRGFTERDSVDSTRVFIINQAAARGLFGNDNPLGRRLAQADGDNLHWGEIVGVVGDVQPIMPDANPVTFQIYQPMSQAPVRQCLVAVLAAKVAPATLVDDIRRTMTGLDADLPVSELQPADVTIHRANYQNRVLRDMLAAFGVLGLALASLGIYGVIARTVAQRTGEFAIRLALGASAPDVVRLVLGAGVKQALLGSGLGLLGAMGVVRVIIATYPSMPANSPLILTITTIVLVVVSLVACWLPAQRAGRVDAMTVLRAE
jgi:predicted permease